MTWNFILDIGYSVERNSHGKLTSGTPVNSRREGTQHEAPHNRFTGASATAVAVPWMPHRGSQHCHKTPHDDKAAPVEGLYTYPHP